MEKLAAHDEIGAAARRHAEFYRDLFASRRLDSQVPSEDEDMEQFIREIDNVRAALDWSFSSAGDVEIGVTLTAAYVPAWLHAALPTECSERTERAMNNLTPEMNVSLPLRMQLHFGFGLMPAYTMSPVEPAKAALAKALTLAEQIGDLQAQFQILWGLWVLNSESGECHTTYAVTEQFNRGRTHWRSVSEFDGATPARFRSRDAGPTSTVAGVLRIRRSALCRADRSAFDGLGSV